MDQPIELPSTVALFKPNPPDKALAELIDEPLAELIVLGFNSLPASILNEVRNRGDYEVLELLHTVLAESKEEAPWKRIAEMPQFSPALSVVGSVLESVKRKHPKVTWEWLATRSVCVGLVGDCVGACASIILGLQMELTGSELERIMYTMETMFELLMPKEDKALVPWVMMVSLRKFIRFMLEMISFRTTPGCDENLSCHLSTMAGWVEGLGDVLSAPNKSDEFNGVKKWILRLANSKHPKEVERGWLVVGRATTLAESLFDMQKAKIRGGHTRITL